MTYEKPLVSRGRDVRLGRRESHGREALVTTRFTRLLVGVALFILSFPACPVDFFDWGKRWNQYAGSPNSISAFDVYKLCLAMFARRHYGRLFLCLDDLENRIKTAKEEDIAVYPSVSSDMPFDERTPTYTLKEVHPAIIHWMRAEVLIELGEPARAVSAAKSSLSSLPEFVRDGKFLSRPFETKRLSVAAFPLQLRSFPEAMRLTLGLAHALNGEHRDALDIAHYLEERMVILTGSNLSKLARIHFALGDYAKVLGLFDKHSPLRDYILLGVGLIVGGAAQVPTLALPGAIAGLALSPFAAVGIDRGFEISALRYSAFHSKLETGDIDAALVGYEELLKNPNLPSFNNLYWAILYDMGRIAEKKGDLDKALEFYRRAIEQIEKLRSSINYEAGLIGFVGDKQPVYEAIVALRFRRKEYADAFEFAERGKARALVDLLAKKNDFGTRAADPQKIRQLLAQTGMPDSRPATLEDANKTRSLADTAQEELKQRVPELIPLISVPPVKLPAITARLAADEALVSYFYTDKDVFAFVLTPQTLHAAKLDRKGLEERVRQFRRVIQRRGLDYLEASRLLYDQLLHPIVPFLTQQKITIAPHGILHYLPFAALNDGTKFAIERYSIRVLPSASTLLYLRSDKSQMPGEILAFGNPDLDDPKFDLNFAQQEALEVAKTLPKSRALIRKEATKTALKDFGPGFRYVHFATHGQFNANDPLASALLLARTDKEDGRLTVGDLYSLQIDADLVTMSACETGLGKIANGDDVIGLTRGFLYAGARSIVASLWQIDDKTTEELMTRFYRYLTTIDKREALRKAQLETLAAFPHPFFWAAFQAIGNAN